LAIAEELDKLIGLGGLNIKFLIIKFFNPNVLVTNFANLRSFDGFFSAFDSIPKLIKFIKIIY
jgi:hypothetical protein